MPLQRHAVHEGPFEHLLHVGVRAFDLITDEIVRNDVRIAKLVTLVSDFSRQLKAAGDELPTALRQWLGTHQELIDEMAGRRVVEIRVIEPAEHLGDGLDFDSERRRGWPERPGEGHRISIMEARFEYGRRLALRSLEQDRDLRRMLESFSRG